MAEENKAILECKMKIRVSPSDAHYVEGMVGGWWLMKLFGDVCNELGIRYDGDLALLVAYESTAFLAPVQVGDFIEATARLIKVGNTSRRYECVAEKIIAASPDYNDPSRGDVVDPPIVVARAVCIDVCPKDKQRIKH